MSVKSHYSPYSKRYWPPSFGYFFLVSLAVFLLPDVQVLHAYKKGKADKDDFSYLS